jgi:hypothetical protein
MVNLYPELIIFATCFRKYNTSSCFRYECAATPACHPMSCDIGRQDIYNCDSFTALLLLPHIQDLPELGTF